jgi:hypothetical protein
MAISWQRCEVCAVGGGVSELQQRWKQLVNSMATYSHEISWHERAKVQKSQEPWKMRIEEVKRWLTETNLVLPFHHHLALPSHQQVDTVGCLVELPTLSSA